MRKYYGQTKTDVARRGIQATLVATVAGVAFVSALGAGAIAEVAAGSHGATSHVAADTAPDDHGWD
jgi:hypothetical protein